MTINDNNNGKKLNLKWVTEAIGDDYKKWRGGDIILLQAQTGTGKTFFIKNKLIDYISDYDQILLVCNRTNLKRQLKIDLFKKYNIEIPMIKDDKGNNTDKINMNLIDKTTQINNIVICSYHAIQESILDSEYNKEIFDLSQYKYIILDEAHYILCDGSFNNKCRLAYKKLIDSYNPSTVKIFISATMEEIETPIRNKTSKIFGNHEIITYKTGIDYSYVNARYFKNIDVIINTIKNDRSQDKWLIFVSNKDQGNSIKKELGEDICETIYSRSKNEELDSIITYSKFNKKVLVATKCLDNGVNFNDDLLTNIVIMTWDRITFIQMLGRKRVNIDNAQEINLYIPTRYKKSFLSKIKNCETQEEEIFLLQKNETEFNRKYDNDLKKISKYEHLFYRDDSTGKWKINIVGFYRVLNDKKFFIDMVEEFKQYGEFAFILKQLEWLELIDTFDLNNYIDEVLLDEDMNILQKYLESILGKKLSKDDQQKVIDKIGLIDARGRQQKSISQLNAYLESNEIPYIIKSERKSIRIDDTITKESYWMIYKIVTSVDSFVE